MILLLYYVVSRGNRFLFQNPLDIYLVYSVKHFFPLSSKRIFKNLSIKFSIYSVDTIKSELKHTPAVNQHSTVFCTTRQKNSLAFRKSKNTKKSISRKQSTNNSLFHFRCSFVSMNKKSHIYTYFFSFQSNNGN